jgi:hypothetical protein
MKSLRMGRAPKIERAKDKTYQPDRRGVRECATQQSDRVVDKRCVTGLRLTRFACHATCIAVPCSVREHGQ